MTHDRLKVHDRECLQSYDFFRSYVSNHEFPGNKIMFNSPLLESWILNPESWSHESWLGIKNQTNKTGLTSKVHQGDMESIYPELALCGSKNECARTDTVFFTISEFSEGTVSLAEQCYTITVLFNCSAIQLQCYTVHCGALQTVPCNILRGITVE